MQVLTLFLALMAPTNEPLTIGVTHFPPMIVVDPHTGSISGSDYEMFELIAADQDWRKGTDYKYQIIASFPEMISKVQSGDVNVAMAGVSINESRLRVMDFSQPYKSSGQRILIPPPRVKVDFLGYVTQFCRIEIAIGILALLFNFILFGVLIWLSERGNKDSNIKTAVEGAKAAIDIGTTIGFGRYWPKTTVGNILLLVCFFSTSLLSGAILATLTTNKMVYTRSTAIDGPKDLKDKTIAAVAGTTSVNAAKEYNPDRIIETENFYQAVVEMRLGNVDAVVADDPVVLNYVKNHSKHAAVTGEVFHPENYGLAITANQGDLEKLFSISIAKLRESGKLKMIEKRWFGKEY